MEDFLWSLWAIDSFSFNVLLALVLVVAWFLKEVAGSGGLAIWSAPFLVLGGLVSRRLFEMAAVPLPIDKDSTVVVATGAGVFIAMLIVVATVYGSARIAEVRSRKRKILPVISAEHIGR